MADNASDVNRLRMAWSDGYVKLRLSVAKPATSSAQVSITVDHVVAKLRQPVTEEQKTRVTDLLHAAQKFNITDPQRVAILLAYCIVNTGGLSSHGREPELPFARTPGAHLSQPIPDARRRRARRGQARPDREQIYGNRLGNVAPDDGWKFRGRGYLQTIGRESYQRSGDLIDFDLVSNPDALTDSKIAAREAAARFAQLTEPDKLESVVRSLRGGIFGLAELQVWYERIAPGGPWLRKSLRSTPAI